MVPADLPHHTKVYYKSDTNLEVSKGTYVNIYVDVQYKCAQGFVLIGKKDNLCLNGEWIFAPPKCEKLCKAPSGISIQVVCEFDYKTISCDTDLRPNTTANILCAPGYFKPSHFHDFLICNEDGEWDYSVRGCEQVCGEITPKGEVLINGGTITNVTSVPWHAGIYSDIRKEKEFLQICGGTIVNARLVISAAHCFWDAHEMEFFEPSHFKVGVGKNQRDLYVVDLYGSQILNVEKIRYSEAYNDYLGLYNSDIALLVLSDYIIFQPYIKPICVEIDLINNNVHIDAGVTGIVAGWGVDSNGISSALLKTIELPVIEPGECRRSFSQPFKYFYTDDKFCAGYINGQGVCKGDSGGGFVVPKYYEGNMFYYLKGIVSIGELSKNSRCGNNEYTLFTNVVRYGHIFVEERINRTYSLL